MNKSSVLYISFLPIIILVVLVLGIGYFLTEGDIELPFGGDGIGSRSLKGFPALVLTSNTLEKQRLVVRSQEELDAFLSTVDSSGQLTLNDKVNFNREYVLAVASETLETDGYKIKVDNITDYPEENKIVVTILLTEPGETCVTEAATQVAVDLVAIKKTDKNIDFERFKKTEECN